MLCKDSDHPIPPNWIDIPFVCIKFTLLVFSLVLPNIVSAGQITTVVIQMTDQGLHPKHVQIGRGTTIFFVNTGKYTHWPASNNHPSHEVYPELDAKETIAPGASWRFTFEKSGTWKIHDHLNPGFEAVVTVVDKSPTPNDQHTEAEASVSGNWLNKIIAFFGGLSSPPPNTSKPTIAPALDDPSVVADSLKFACTDKDASNFDCYKKYYKARVRFDGIAAAFEDAKRREKTNAYARSMCHPIVHVIGHAAVKQFDSVASAFKQGDDHCWSGYYHGVMEGIIARIGRDKLPQQIATICSEIPGKESYSFDFYNCIHGLGHGVMAANGIELFDSLELCAKLTGSWEKSSCYSGVYMENVMVDYRGQHTKYLKSEDPVYPCNAVENQYKNDCFMMQTSYMLKIVAGDFKKVFEICASVEDGYRNTCYQSLGRDAASRSSNGVLATKTSCDLGIDIEAKTNCIIGASKNFVSALHDDQRANSLCNAIDADIKSTCLATVDQYYQIF